MNIAEWFYDSAARRPDHPAVDGLDGPVSYARMLALVNGLRQALATVPGERAAICAHRGLLAYAGIQAILAEGRAFVSLNAKFPPKRNAFILNKAAVRVAILHSEWASSLAELLADTPDLALTVLVTEPLERFAGLREKFAKRLTFVSASESTISTPPRVPVQDDTAYVIFTSGSTGQPKGVRVRHGSFREYMTNFLRHYALDPSSRLSSTFDLTFDLSLHDQFLTWATGATLVPFPQEVMMTPLAYAKEHRITVWYSVPSLVAYLEGSRQAEENALPLVTTSFFCGEKLNWNTLQIWRRIAPNSRAVNLYGPTEGTVIIAHFAVAPDTKESDCHNGCLPIGRVFDNQKFSIRRPDGSECAVNETGVLWLGGSQLSAGYEGEPELTAERFVAREDGLWYNTGDLVFRQADGTMQYVGREDFQVKIMGYRIELGEIEHVLLESSGAPQAVADVREEGGVTELFAVLPAAVQDRKKAIRDRVREKLPAYMVPRKFYFVEAMPLNANGKIDRAKLREMVLRAPAEGT